jgi:hypothetical protein
VAGPLNRGEHRLELARPAGVVLKPVRHEDDVDVGVVDINRTHEAGALDDVAIDLLLDNRDDFRLPMVMEVAFADQLRDVPLVDIVPIQTVGRPLV